MLKYHSSDMQCRVQIDGSRLGFFEIGRLEQQRQRSRKKRNDYYSTEWGALQGAPAASSTLLVLADQGSNLRGGSASTAGSSSKKTADIIAIVRSEKSQAPLVLCALETAMTLMQTQTSKMSPTWLLTSSAPAPECAGTRGLVRVGRAEAMLPLHCIGALTPAEAVARCCVSDLEPEVTVSGNRHIVPRLKTAPSSFNDPIRLQFHSRGAIRNLFLEEQPSLALGDGFEVVLRVCACGLNFRDVLNVLGEYPGDPGPPGLDTSGTVTEATDSALQVVGMDVFGVAHAPLATMACAQTPLLARKPFAFTFEEACTMPVVWSTVHMALEHAGAHESSAILVHAAAGGVGRMLVEYGQWLGGGTMGTAGQPAKHRQTRTTNVLGSTSLRDSSVFAKCAMGLLQGCRMDALLNSLSVDFISVSFALLREGGSFEEVGKRAIWAPVRHTASSPSTSYAPVAFDQDMSNSPMWFHGIMNVLARRADVAEVTSLPLSSFDLVSQYATAFRTLQSGKNLGKMVVRIPAQPSGVSGAHVVMGGTGGLGMLTGRWLAQRGASRLILASRGAKLAKETMSEWEAVQASGTQPST